MDLASSFYFTRPEIILSAAGLILLIIAAWREDSGRALSIAAVAALVAAGSWAAHLIYSPSFELGGDAFSGLYRMDIFGSFAKILIYVAAAISLIIAPRFLKNMDAMRAEYPVLILFAVVGMGIMVSANDLITLYIGLELNSLSAYVLASFARSDRRSVEAGLKYFILGALASGILLFGMSLVYGFTGTTGFDAIGKALSGDMGMGALFGVVFMLSGLAFKISAAPFHMWTPDVYEGVPTPVTAFFASAPKVAAMALFIRIVFDTFEPIAKDWQQIVIFLSLASMVLAAFAAIGQKKLKRLIAYSSIGHVGFALVGLSAGSQTGVEGVAIYMAIYLVMTIGLFACILALRTDQGYVEDISDLAGIAQTRPFVAAGIALIMFSLIGLPPLAGFFAKWEVFLAAIEAQLFVLAVVGVLASAVSAFYYLRVIRTMYFDEPNHQFINTPNELNVVIALSGFLIVAYAVVVAGPLKDIAGVAAGSLF